MKIQEEKKQNKEKKKRKKKKKVGGWHLKKPPRELKTNKKLLPLSSGKEKSSHSDVSIL